MVEQTKGQNELAKKLNKIQWKREEEQKLLNVYNNKAKGEIIEQLIYNKMIRKSTMGGTVVRKN